jgi:ABC-type Fe3+-siderophore transport system permease subunit
MLYLAQTARWKPVIGDPTLMGWVIASAYLIASLACILAAFRRPRGSDPVVTWFWLSLFAMLAFLAFNKQLDLQFLLTQTGRDLFKEMDWYENRREAQRIFVFALGLAAFILVCFLFWRFRWEHRPLRISLAGILFLFCFILIRAASFHHLDDILVTRFAGVRVRSFLELAGIALVGWGALLYLRRGGR